MGQSSSQPDHAANENITSPKREEEDSTHTAHQVFEHEFPFLSAQVPPLSQEEDDLQPLSHPDPIVWSSSIGYLAAEDTVNSNVTDSKDKAKDSLTMPPPTMDRGAEQDRGKRKEMHKDKKRKRRRGDTGDQKSEQDNTSLVASEMDEEGHLPVLKQWKTVVGHVVPESSTTNAERYPQTPTQSKKQRKKLKEEIKTEHRGSSIPIDPQSSIAESPVYSSSIPNYSDMSKTQKTNARNRLKKRLKREGNLSLMSIPSPTPTHQSRSGVTNDKGTLPGAETLFRASIQTNGIHTGKQQAPSNDMAKVVNGLPQTPKRRRKKRKTRTVSELTNHNLNSQSFKSARIKHEQDLENVRVPADTAGRQDIVDDEAPVESSIDNFATAEIPRQNAVEDEGSHPEENLKEQSQDKSACVPSPTRIVESSSRSPSPSLQDSIREEQVEEDDVQFLPTEEISEDDDPIEKMDREPHSDIESSVHNGSTNKEVLDKMDSNSLEDTDASSVDDNSAPIEGHLAESMQNDKKRYNDGDLNDAEDDNNDHGESNQAPPSKKIRLESSTISTPIRQTSSQNDTEQSISESASSDPALSPKHRSAMSPKPDSMLINGKKLSEQTPRRNTSLGGKKHAYKSAELVIDSEDENINPKHDMGHARDPISTPNVQRSDGKEITQSKSASDVVKPPRRLPVTQRKERGTLATGKNSATRMPKRELPTAIIPAGQRKTGPFEDYEIAQLNEFQERWCAMNGVSESDFRLKIHDNAHNNPTLRTFWGEMQEALANRDRKSLQRFCRRRWSQAENKGAFSEEDDRQLIKLLALHGPQWVIISEHLGYTPEAIRDHYRNVVKDQSTRNLHSWDDEETLQLRHIMGQLGIELLQQSFSVEEIPKYITWNVVSEKMGGRRGRIQCAYKWRRLIIKNVTTLGKEIWSANTRLGLDVDLADIDLAGVEMADDTIVQDNADHVEGASATP